MKHPTDEQWMELLYSELPPKQKSEIEAHIKSCAACAQKRATYINTRQRLDTWNVVLPEKPKLTPQWSPLIKWAAAAALLVSTAFATGRLSKPSFDSDQIQAKIARDLDGKVQEQARLVARSASDAVLLKVQAEFAARLQQISERVAADMEASKEQTARALAGLHNQDRTLYAALQEIEGKRQAENRAIREDLERLALFTDDNLRSAQRQLVQLASFNESPQP